MELVNSIAVYFYHYNLLQENGECFFFRYYYKSIQIQSIKFTLHNVWVKCHSCFLDRNNLPEDLVISDMRKLLPNKHDLQIETTEQLLENLNESHNEEVHEIYSSGSTSDP